MKLMFYSSDNSAVEVDIYQRSMQVLDNDMVFMASTDLGDVVIITSNGQYRILELNHDTAMFLRKNFPFTAPSRVLHLDKTIGTENVLEVANDECTAYVYASNYTPVLAQHSNNGLQLTGRSFEDILDSATFEVFKNGYKKPWGAGGNNLKKPEEIEQVISCGYTMVTLISAVIGIDPGIFEAAELDGAGRFRTFIAIEARMTAPIFWTFFINNTFGLWNDYLNILL